MKPPVKVTLSAARPAIPLDLLQTIFARPIAGPNYRSRERVATTTEPSQGPHFHRSPHRVRRAWRPNFFTEPWVIEVSLGDGNIRCIEILCTLNSKSSGIGNVQSAPTSSNETAPTVESAGASWNETVQATPAVGSAGASSNGTMESGASATEATDLAAMLERAATGDKTVIITTLNQAWTKPGAMLDVFLDSFQRGEGTQLLLRHLVMVALDQQSLERCQQVHAHCFRLATDGVDFSGSKGFMTADFLKMMWRRMELLRSVLELGYNFVFTDADILWLRNPFEHFFNDVDFQISCDKNRGNAWSLMNKPNCRYQYARSNERTIAMYRHWCKGGEKNPHIHEQSLLNVMLHSKAFVPYKVRIRFLSTEEFSGFCNGSKNMLRVVTMHANCCTGLSNKVKDLRKALKAWELGKSSPGIIVKKPKQLWHVPDACRHSIWPSPPPPSLLADVTT